MAYTIDDHDIDAETRVVALGGEADAAAAPSFEERLGRAFDDGKRYVVVDLLAAKLIDSRIIGVLMGGRERIEAGGGKLAVACTDNNLLRLFSLTGIDRSFPIYPSLDQAIAAR